MTDSRTLLVEYVTSGSESAFRELVSRYLGLVYSTALRLVGGDTHLAEDVAQTVFIDLARKAGGISDEVRLGGWLHQRTFNVAAPLMRAQRRRQAREREAAHVNALPDESDGDLSRIEPVLDEAITHLGLEDRTAILLRFFERRDFRSIADALGSSEDAARMRVNRALEKLHVLLMQRGATIPLAALAGVLASDAIAVAPVGLAAAVSGAALAKVAVAGTLGSTFLKGTAMTKLHAATIGAAILIGVASLVIQNRAQVKLREENQSLRLELEKVQSENARLASQIGQASPASALPSDRLRELLRLRGEVGLLRRQQRELEQAMAAAKGTLPGSADQPAVGNLKVGTLAPFQVQLVLDEAGEETEPMTRAIGGASSETLHVRKAPVIDYTAVSSASVSTNWQTGHPQIEIELNEVGRDLFAQVTKENLNKRLALVLDGQLHSAPVVRSEIATGKMEVTGSFTEEEARMLADKINKAIARE